MKILVIKSSGNRYGSSNTLADSFIRGAEESGNSVVEFDAAHSDIRPCMGCNSCAMDGPCVFKDDMVELRNLMLSSDMVVFVTPLYYYGFSSILKTTIDRWYSFTMRLSSKRLKTALIVASWDSNDWTMKDIASHYKTLCKYMNFQSVGEILGLGCGTVSMTKSPEYMKKAYDLGKSLN